MNTLQARADQALAAVRAMVTPARTPLFAGVGILPCLSPLATVSLPLALLSLDSLCNAFEAVLVYDVAAMMTLVDTLSYEVNVDWVGTVPHYEVQDGVVYCRVPFTVKREEQQ